MLPNKTQSIVFAALLFLGWGWNVQAQSEIFIDLSKKTHPEIHIAVTHFIPVDFGTDVALAELGRETLENDLQLFELFLPVNPETFADLEKSELTKPRLNYQLWKSRGIQWLVKTHYEILERGQVSITVRLYDVVNEQFLLGKRYRGLRTLFRKMMHRIADEIMDKLTGQRGIAETRLVFLSRSQQGKEVYRIDFDGHNLKKLTNENAVVLSPDWSPDGKSIVFTSLKDRNPDLIKVDWNGRNRRTLLKLPGLNSAPAWSPDGGKISLVLSKDQNSEIYVLNRFSQLRRLTRHFNIDTSPTWSPDGKRIAFTSDRSGTGQPQIYIMDAVEGDRMGVQRITYDSNYNDNPAWSPEGDRIAFTARVGKTFQIKIYNVETQATIEFTGGPGNKEDPAWSPDGRFLAYGRTLGKDAGIYIQRIGSDKSRRLTNLKSNGISPTWSPYSKR